MKNIDLDGGEFPVLTVATGTLIAMPFAITGCPCHDCGGELVPSAPFERMICSVDDVHVETPFDDEIGSISMAGDWRERAQDAYDDDFLLP